MTRVESGNGRQDRKRRGWRGVVWQTVTLALGIGSGGWPAIGDAQVTYNVFPAVAPSAPAQPTPQTGQLVTLTAHDSTIDAVVNALARQAHAQLLYDNSNPVFAKRIAVRVANLPVINALGIVLKGTGLVATMAADQETIVIRPRAAALGAARDHEATGSILGRVTDSASGAGIGGATVKVEGMKLSAITSDSGHFTLRDVPAGDQVLSVRLFGYKPVERTVTVVDSQRTMVRIVMVPVPTVLSGVVTTATGAQRKIEVGNDITSLNVDSIMQVSPISSVTDLLETRVPGLTVMHSSGEPGSPSRLRLRGVGSISGNNDPIVVVDGVRVYANQSDSRNANLAPTDRGRSGDIFNNQPGHVSAPSPIDQIDPNSIETIEVFKGPSASALYGSDAANGVIVITTKHGRAGPTHWSLDLGQGVNWVPGNWPTNYFRFGVNVHSQGPFCNWYDPTCLVIDSVRTFQALNDPRYTVFTHGSDQSANLTISGGVPTLQYSITGSGTGTMGNLQLPVSEQQRYDAAIGPIPNWMVHPDNYTTWGVNGSLTAHPQQNFQVTLQSSLFNSVQHTSSLQGAITQLEGLYISNNVATIIGGVPTPLSAFPLVENYVERVTGTQVTSQNNMTLSWQPRPWLPMTANGGLQTIQRTDVSYIPYGVSSSGPSSCGGNNTANCGIDTTGYYGLGRGVSHNQTLAAGTAIPLLQQRMTVAVGGNLYTSSTNDFRASTNQLAPGVSTPTSFVTLCGTALCGSSTQDAASASTYGWYVEPRFNFASRFFAAPGFRFDGGSGGAPGGGTGGLSAFPKLDLSYVAVDRQSGRPLWGVLTLLRPRVAFGLAGTQPAPEDRLRLFNIGSGSALGLNGQGNLTAPSTNLCSATIPLNGVEVPGVCLQSLGNTQLRPERSNELEGGFDANLWNNRLQFTYTQYNKTRKDAIISIPVAPSVSQIFGGSFNIADNLGEVRNTGTELTVNAIVLQSRAFSWNVGANMSNDNNLLVHLNRGQVADTNLGIVPGYPLFGIWERPILSVVDQNHDHIIEPNEIVVGKNQIYVGQPNPKFEMNLNTGVTLLNGRLSINATFAYQNGLTQNNEAAVHSNSFLAAGNNPNTPLAYQAAVVAISCRKFFSDASCYNSDVNIGNASGFIQTVNTFRFDALSINYEVPRYVSSWFKVPRMTMALQGSNLALHSNYRGADPNVNAFSTVSSVDETADLGQIPEPRTWWLKLTLGN